MSDIDARGVLYVHSAPAALCPHIEWAVGAALGAEEKLDWEAQRAGPGTYRVEINWMAAQGSGVKLASSLRGWAHLRYEITEEASEGSDGSRWSHTPELGIFHATTEVTGNIMVSEEIGRAHVCTPVTWPARMPCS